MSGLLEVLFIVGALAGLVLFVVLWRRFPRRRWQLAAGATLIAGATVFTVWWTMFRVDDPTFSADRAHAIETQKALDKALGGDF